MNQIDHKKVSRPFVLLAWLAIGSWTGLVFILLFLGFYPFDVLYIKQPFEVLNENKTVKTGEELVYAIDYNKKMNVRAESNWHLSCNNQTIITLASTSTNFPTGHNIVYRSMPIPSIAPEGVCKLNQSIEFYVTPLQIQRYHYETEEFKVVK